MAGGPLLASPLSTTLSAMVQDLKRSGSVRRESVLASDELGEPLDRRRTGPDDEDVPVPIRRGRSLSGTLGDLWTRGASYVQGKSSREGLRDEERGSGE